MQIKLIPASSLPTVLFTVTYSEPPDYLGFPASWAQALHRLSADDLELPGTVHAFDKTTWIVAILHSVTFDLARRSIVCTYVDGCTQVWPLDEGEDVAEEGKGRCMQELESVLRDVNQSAVEAEREKKRIEQVQQNMQRPPASPCPSQTMSEPILPTQATVNGTSPANGKHTKEGKEKDGKHKKQRSLLMSLVASLVSPNKHGHSSAHHGQVLETLPAPVSPLASPAPSHASVTSDADEDDVERMSSTALRRRARSTLVNAFRRYVLMRLSTAAQPGGYTAWVARSMLTRVEGEMAQMVRDAGGPPDMDPSMGFYYGKTSAMAMRRGKAQSEACATRATDTGPEGAATPNSTLVDEPPPFFDEEDGDTDGDRDSASTDTDGSSVHTPDTVSFDGSPFFSPPLCSSPPPSPPSSPTPPALSPSASIASSISKSPSSSPVSPNKRQLRRQTIFAHRTPSPSPVPHVSSIHGRPYFSPCDLAAYTALSGQRLRLQSVLTRIDAQLAMQAQDERQLQSVLEIKSRRRAWSNGQYMGGALVKHMGLCTPARSSPLARYEPINASDLVDKRSTSVTVLEGVGKPKRGLIVTTAEHNIMRLFPVCEEEEEEQEEQEEEEPAPPYQRNIGDPPSLPDMNEKDESLLSPAVQTVRLVESRGLHDGENDVILPLPLQLQRHAVPIRPRTRSMMQGNTTPAHNTASTYPRALDPDNEKMGLSVLEPQTKVELFDVYHSEDEEDDDPRVGNVGVGLDGCGGKHSEFTLGMEIPEPFTMGIGGRRYDHDEWISVANASIPSR